MLHRIRKTDNTGAMQMIWENNRLLNILIIVLMAFVVSLAANFLQPESVFGEDDFTFIEVESIDYQLADTRTDVADDGSLCYYEKEQADEGSEYVYGFQAAEGDKLILKYNDDSTATYVWTPGTSEEPGLFVNISNSEDTLTFGDREEDDIIWSTNEFDDEYNLYWKPELEGMAVTISFFDIFTEIPVQIIIPEDPMAESIEYQLADTRTDVADDGSLCYFEKQEPDEGSEYVYGFQAAEGDKLILKYDDDSSVTYAWTPGTSGNPGLFVNTANAEDTLTFGNKEESNVIWSTNELDADNHLSWKAGKEGMAVTISYLGKTTDIPVQIITSEPAAPTLQAIEYKLADTRTDVTEDGSIWYYEKEQASEGSDYVYGFQAAEGDELILKFDDDSTATYAWTPGTTGNPGLFVNTANAQDTLTFGNKEGSNVIWSTNELDADNHLSWKTGKEGMAVTITYLKKTTNIPVVLISSAAVVDTVVQATSAEGYSVSTTERDTNGNETTTTTNYDADGGVTGTQETRITKDSDTATETTVIKDKDGKTIRTITTTSQKSSDGTTSLTTQIKDGNGNTVSSREGTSKEQIKEDTVTTNTVETTKDAAGNVIVTTDKTVTDNADKTRTTSVTRTSANGVRQKSTETTVRKNEDGSTTTTIVTRDSNNNITGKTITNIKIESNKTTIDTSSFDKDGQVTGQKIKTITTSDNTRDIEIISKDKDGSVSGRTTKKITISDSQVLTETAEYDGTDTLISTSQSAMTTSISDGKPIIETQERIMDQQSGNITKKTETRTETIITDVTTKAVTTTADITSVTNDVSGTEEAIIENVSKEETTTIASDGETLLGSHSKTVTKTTETDRSVSKTVKEAKDADGQITRFEEVVTDFEDGSRTTEITTTTYDQNGTIKEQSQTFIKTKKDGTTTTDTSSIDADGNEVFGHSTVNKYNTGKATIVTEDKSGSVLTIQTAAFKKGKEVELLTFKPTAKAALSPQAERNNEIALVKVEKNTRSITVPATIDAANGVTYTVRMIANKAFKKNSAGKITMGPIKNICSYAFAGAKTRKIIIDVSELSSVGKKAFKKNKATVILKGAKGKKLAKAKKMIKAAGAKKVK